MLSVESDAGEIDIEADGRDKGASGAHSITLHDGGGRFSFDRVFPGLTSNRSVYETVGRPLVMSLLEGYNATLLAYGQTGTGKTYTLGEPHRVDTIEEGLMPRMLRELFEAGGGGARQGGGRGSGGAGSGGAGERAGGRAAGGGGAAGAARWKVSLQYYQLYLDRVPISSAPKATAAPTRRRSRFVRILSMAACTCREARASVRSARQSTGCVS